MAHIPITEEQRYILVMNDCPTVRKLEALARKMQAHIDNNTYKPEHRSFMCFYPFELIPAHMGDCVQGFLNKNKLGAMSMGLRKMIVGYYEAECGFGNFRQLNGE